MKILSQPGAEKEFAEAFEQYSDALFRHCAFRCFDRERAKELVQETFMKTWSYLATGRDIDNVQAFLYRTANNVLIDEARRAKKRQVVSFEDMQEQGFDIEGENGERVHTTLDAAQVVHVMSQVDEPYRTALIMRYIDEMKPAEIADLLGETSNVISVRINRGIKMLKGVLPKQPAYA